MFVEKAASPAYQKRVRALRLVLSPGLAALALALVLYLGLGAYQLSLPGLQYDEAKEAGVNAMQLVTGQPLTAFRDATVQIGPWRLPLMVQDYIGAANALLAAPFLALGGINVVALRWLPLLIGALTLWLAWRAALRLGGLVAACATVIPLAVNPTFLFWNRQGIFVTNLTALLSLASLLAALRWWDLRRTRDLCWLAFWWGLGIYAKLLFVWVIGAMVIAGAGLWLATRRGRGGALAWTGNHAADDAGPLARSTVARPQPAGAPWASYALALACFLAPLLPLVIFNLQTGGTLASIFGNLGRSYYGVDNRAYWPNLVTRLGQLRILLEGNHLWYLGEVYANHWAPWAAGGLVALAVVAGTVGRSPRMHVVLLPLALLLLGVAQSAFTVSDLFITHYAMLLPLVFLAGGLAAGSLWEAARKMRFVPARFGLPVLAALLLLGWAGGDVHDTLAYHRILTVSGGYGSHSDAIYRLADYLVLRRPAAPLALDWGLDAQLRFLTGGQVNPVEVFGYSPLDRPDPGFDARVTPFLGNPDTLYIAHVPDETVFRGRKEALADLASRQGLVLTEVARFGLRSGRPLFVVYRALPPG